MCIGLGPVFYSFFYCLSTVKCNRLFDLPDFDYNYLRLVVSTDRSQGIYRGIRSLFALSALYIHRGFSTNNFWLLVVLAFTTANSVHLTMTTS